MNANSKKLTHVIISIEHQPGFFKSHPPTKYIVIAATEDGNIKCVGTPDLLSNVFNNRVIIITNIMDTIKLL